MLTVTIDCLPDCCRGRVYFLEEKQIWRSRVRMMRWAQMSETHDERGPLGWRVVAGAEHGGDERVFVTTQNRMRRFRRYLKPVMWFLELGWAPARTLSWSHTRGAGCRDG